MNKGRIQNILIFLLVSSSLILLSIRFELFVSTDTSTVTTLDNKSVLRYSVRPNSIILRLGTGNSTKILDKGGFYYADVARVLEEAIQQKTAIVPLHEAEYREQKKSRSIQLNFEPAIDQRLLYGSLFLEDGSIGEFKDIYEILIPQTYDTSIYIKTNDNRNYRIENPQINTLPNFDSLVNLGYTKYYSLSDRFPELTISDVPISDEAHLPSYVTTSMFNENNTDNAIRAVLGSKYDVANKISEIDGSTIVTYDFGREIIKISPEGKVFYYNKDAESGKKRTSKSDAMSIAMQFVDALSVDEASYVVEKVSEYKSDHHTGYEVSVTRRIDGIRVSLKDDKAFIKVVVINNRVYSLEGIFRTPTIPVDNSLSFGENAIVLILENNLDYIKQKEPFKSTSELFDKIHSVEYAYTYSKDYNYIACYRMVIGKTTFFFKIEDAEVIL
ncbi:MAG: hypothetical protein Q4D65_01825 [Peptostreptococcaceae bacterium]|nr:hypothetical protein [Peptostreptococcaceae bacterium]